MNTRQKDARFAGFIYLLMGVTAPFSLLYVPRALVVQGDVTATAGRILASETMFRLAIAAELISAVIFIYLALALHKLLRDVDEGQAVLMVILAVLSVPISFVNVLNEIAALTLFRGGDFLSVFDKPRLDAMAMMFLRMHNYGLVVAAIFWGLWLFPLGILVFKSRFMPRILGIALVINGCAYLAQSYTALTLPAYRAIVNRATFVALTGELFMMLWLLIWGAKTREGEPVWTA
jgi:uncharacterized protein DUF4386